MHSLNRFMIAFIAAALLAFAPVSAAQNLRDIEVRAEKVSGNVYVLYGQGGNIGLSIGDDGAFMIDDQFAPATPRILEAIEKLTDKPVVFVINTHWHGDHTGGNENFGGEGAIIVAHENVRERLSTEQVVEAVNFRQPAAPDEALPVITFTRDMTFHWNDDEIEIRYVPHAHTNSDSIIHFREVNVFHMGDVYISGMYPFIDAGSGGSIYGVIDAVNGVLERSNSDTRIIPGHGTVTGIDELREYRDMLVTVRDRIEKMMREGKSKEEIVAAKPTSDLDATWTSRFIQPDQFVGFIYDGMAAHQEREAQRDADE